MYMNIFAPCNFNFAPFSHIVNRQNSAHLKWKVINISSNKTLFGWPKMGLNILHDIGIWQK